MPSIDPKKIQADLGAAADALARNAEKMEDRLLAAMQRSQSRIFARTAELMTEAPIGQAFPNAKKLAWYTQTSNALYNYKDPITGKSFITSHLDDVRAYVGGLGRMSELTNAMLAIGAQFPGGITTLAPEVIEALKAQVFTHFEGLAQEAMNALDDVLLDQTLTATSRASALGHLKGVITGEYKWGNRTGLYEWHAGTYARTAHMRFSRTVQGMTAEQNGLKQFIFVGPGDGKTRDWCIDHLGNVYTRDEIDQMDNGQLPNAWVNGGGWNCRHVWAGVSDAVARAIKDQDTITVPPPPKGGGSQKQKTDEAKTAAKKPFTKVPKWKEFDTIDDAVEFSQRLGIRSVNWNVSRFGPGHKPMTNLDDVLANINAVNREAIRFLKRNPRFLNKLPHYDCMLGNGGVANYGGRTQALIKNPQGYRFSIKKDMTISKQQIEQYGKIYERDGFKGNIGIVEPNDSWGAVKFRHEMMHVMCDGTDVTSGIDDVLIEMGVKNKWRVWARKNISGYATSTPNGAHDKGELIAEAYAWYTSPDYTGNLPKAMTDFLDNLVTRWVDNYDEWMASGS